jgi:hypothetical protein
VERAHISRSNLLVKCKDTVCKVSELRNGVNTVSQASFSETNALYLHFYCGFFSVNSLNCNFCHPRVPYLFSRAFSRISVNGQYSAAVTLLLAAALLWTVPWLRRLVAGLIADARVRTMSFHVTVKLALGQVFSDFLVSFTLSLSFDIGSTDSNIISPGAWTIGMLVVAVQRHSPAPLTWTWCLVSESDDSAAPIQTLLI